MVFSRTPHQLVRCSSFFDGSGCIGRNVGKWRESAICERRGSALAVWTDVAPPRLPVAHLSSASADFRDRTILYVCTRPQVCTDLRSFCACGYFISCSKLSNSSVEKNSPNVISNPSQNFLIVTMEMSRRVSSIILYAVDGVTPDKLANSLIAIWRCSQIARKRSQTASFTLILLTS